MNKALILTLALGLVFAGTAFAGDTDKTPETMVTKIEKLEASAKKGCATSAAKLESLKKACGTDDIAKVKEYAKAYEQYACNGCESSKAQLAKMDTALKAEVKLPLSARVARYMQGCEKGCKTSNKVMAALLADCGGKCQKTLVAKIEGLEVAAKKGDKEATAKLARYEAIAFNAQPLSKKVAHYARSSTKGCKKSGAKVAALMALANQPKGTETKVFLATIEGWETKADNGCKNCVGKIATLDKVANRPLMAVAAPAKAEGSKKSDCSNCKDCTDCTDCGGCPGKSGKPAGTSG